MEDKLLKIIKLADELNEKSEDVYAQIEYLANDTKILELSIRNKHDYSYVKECKLNMNNASLIQWDVIISMLERYIEV